MDINVLPSFPRRRESSQLDDPRMAGRHFCFVCYTEFLICWIPACAGMTK
jgi:hypothetical protein